jgi:hypothetical protein
LIQIKQDFSPLNNMSKTLSLEMLMTPKRTDHCRLPQRSDTVSGVELVVGLTPICAVPDSGREQAVINAPADEIRASKLLKKKQSPCKG